MTWFKDSGKIFETDRALMTSKGDTWSLKISGLQVLDQPDGDCDGSSDGAGDYYGDGESD